MRFDAWGFIKGLYTELDATGVGVAERSDEEPGSLSAPDDGGVRPDDLPERWREWYEERAAIREHDGGQAREHAEAEALKETIAAMRAAGVACRQCSRADGG